MDFLTKLTAHLASKILEYLVSSYIFHLNKYEVNRITITEDTAGNILRAPKNRFSDISISKRRNTVKSQSTRPGKFYQATKSCSFLEHPL